MKQKILAVSIMLLILAATLLAVNTNTSGAATADPASLKIYIGPKSVLADNSTYNCIFVQLIDSTGKPSRALQDTTITLSSSLTIVGTVDETVIIPKDATYTSANFYSTFSPGKTTIIASSTGFQTVQSTIDTIGPIPSAIMLYALPPILPADGHTYSSVMVQLQDTDGYPAKAPEGGISVVLSSSNPSIGDITSPVIIEKDQTYTIANFTTASGVTGSSVITSIVTGYTVKNTLQITAKNISTTYTGQKLTVYTAPVPADKSAHRPIAILMQNSAGDIISAPADLTINLGSSNPSIGVAEQAVIVPTGEVYGTSNFTTTFKAGSTIITAAASGYVSATKSITTYGFTPSKIAVYCAPPALPSDQGTYAIVHVQLQDSQGRPARAPEATVFINMSSSDPSKGTLEQVVAIPIGQTQTVVPLTVTNAHGSTTITAQASGYDAGTAQLTTYLIDFSSFEISVTANPTSINNGNTANISVTVRSDSASVEGATVTFTSDNSGSFSNKQNGDGVYSATFTAPNFSQTTTCTITATVTKEGYIDSQATVHVTVSPASTSNPTATPTPSPSTTPTLAKTGTIQLRILDSDGEPLSNAVVQSFSVPAGAKGLFGTTNTTGYVIFEDTLQGSYIFNITAAGYQAMDPTISLTSQVFSLPLSLLDDGAPQDSADNTLWIIVIVVVIVAVVISVVVFLLLKKRKGNSRVQKLQELQKKLKQKF